jgi:hypothetical protein
MAQLKTLVVALAPMTKMETPELEIESEWGGRSDVRHEVDTAARSTRQATRDDKGRRSTSDADAGLERGRHGEPRG